ncbi:hypothetical protein WJX81_001577 [Elliptochloris bilobata]|uniref:GATA-type domain-containing protein n=1 Tax=Elliptochloris bilobata TaxID=381761 RepID=A0AAW1QZ15_9CHLO
MRPAATYAPRIFEKPARGTTKEDGICGRLDGDAIALFQGRALAQPCPFAAALPTYTSSRAKTCAHCGTARTPQWREGPNGPKTLCNACGVKLVRANAKHKDNPKRRAAAKAAASADARLIPGGKGGAGAAAASVLPPPVAAPLPKQSSGSLTSDSGAPRVRGASSPVLRRPQRKAAAKAATLTAGYASTGDWPEEAEAPSSQGAVRRVSADALQTLSSRSTGSVSDNSAAGMSDAAEEVAWPALRVVAPPRSAAAAACERADAEADAGPLSPAVAADEEAGLGDVGGAAAVLAEGETLRKVRDGAAREAAAADAAVAAVAKILAVKQAAATRARTAAAVAADDLDAFLRRSTGERFGTRPPKKARRGQPPALM